MHILYRHIQVEVSQADGFNGSPRHDQAPCDAPRAFWAGQMFETLADPSTCHFRYDWTRHEKSLHLSLEKWLCAPLGQVEFRCWVSHVLTALLAQSLQT